MAFQDLLKVHFGALMFSNNAFLVLTSFILCIIITYIAIAIKYSDDLEKYYLVYSHYKNNYRKEVKWNLR